MLKHACLMSGSQQRWMQRALSPSYAQQSFDLYVLSAAPADNKGKIIGAAEGNKEMADRHHGFGAYDVPFLGPTRTGMKDQSEHGADAEVCQGTDP